MKGFSTIIEKLGWDKAVHFLISFILSDIFTRIIFNITSSTGFMHYFGSALVGFVITYFIGVMKEIYDAKSGTGVADITDIYANAAGCSCGAIFELLLLFIGL